MNESKGQDKDSYPELLAILGRKVGVPANPKGK